MKYILILVLLFTSCSKFDYEVLTDTEKEYYLLNIKFKNKLTTSKSLEEFSANVNSIIIAENARRFKPYEMKIEDGCSSKSISGPRKPNIVVNALVREIDNPMLKYVVKVGLNSMYDRYSRSLRTTLTMCEEI